MNAHRPPGLVGIGIVVAMAAAALAWRDCTLLAGTAVLALRVFLIRMDSAAPWRVLSAAVNCLTAGMLASVAGIALMAEVGAAWLGWWQPAAEHPELALSLLAAAAAWCCLSRDSREGAAEELRLWAVLLAGVAFATFARASGIAFAPCIFASGIGLAMLWAGWRLAADTTSTLLRSGSESG
jgi:hypothetical protein